MNELGVREKRILTVTVVPLFERGGRSKAWGLSAGLQMATVMNGIPPMEKVLLSIEAVSQSFPSA
ncbi:MAG: hypothetical protein K5657_09380 [Desulfovibrio sp.]|nr:hypothetical protein [Desulfovibrio sp.]